MNFAALGCTCQIKNSIKGLHKALWNTDTLVDFVRIDEIAVDMNYDDYSVIYLPFPIWISRKTVAKLEKWVAGGGTLVVEASAGQFDENYYTVTKVPGMGLDKIVGCERADIRSMKNVPALVYNGKKIATGFYKEVLRPTTGKVVGTFETGEPAIVMNTYGKGRAVYIGSNPFYSYNKFEDPNLLGFLADMNAGVPREVYSDHKAVTARLLKDGDTWIVFLMNTLNKTLDAGLTIEATGAVTDLFTGKPVAATVARGSSTIANTLTPFETRIFTLKKT
jgi:beta-galactosidase GanA